VDTASWFVVEFSRIAPTGICSAAFTVASEGVDYFTEADRRRRLAALWHPE